MGIHEKEEELFARWETAMAANVHKNFVKDGLLYRGGARSEKEDSGLYVWGTIEGDDDEIWNSAPRRLLIVSKDLNDDVAWDIRTETGYKNTCNDDFDWECVKPFYKRLRAWSYGLLKTDNNGTSPCFDDAANMDNSAPFYLEAPIARMNVKKVCGGGSLADSVLQEHLKDYKDYIIEQLDIYEKADIILSCSSAIKDFIKDYYIKDLTRYDEYGDWVYYSLSTSKILINAFHPSARKNDKEMFDDMMTPFCECVKMLWGKK